MVVVAARPMGVVVPVIVAVMAFAVLMGGVVVSHGPGLGPRPGQG